ncbi:MAG: efflux RND transporter permease subunit [Planctomycetota bacterium]
MKLLENLTTSAVEHPLITVLAGIFISLLGFFGLAFLLPIQQEPPVKIPVIIVSVPYPGASPWEVQSEIIRELEEKLKGLENVDHIYSTAAESLGVTTVRFADRVDVEKAKTDVRERVDQAKPEFPEEAEEPIVSDVDFEDLPALFITLTDSEGAGSRTRTELLQDLNRLGEAVEDRLLQVNGVSTVDIYGELEKEVRIRLNPKRMEVYGLSFDAVGKAVSAQNLAMPGGSLDLAESTMVVRVSGKFTQPEDLAQVVVSASENGLVHLEDIVDGFDTYKKATSYSRLQGNPAVTLVVHKKTGANVLRLLDGLKAEVAGMQDDGLIPERINISLTKDQSYWIAIMLGQLGSSALFGGLLVVVILYFGMGMRSGFLLALAIPFSVLFCALCQTLFGISINSMTLFSLILILGMVVDGAIVVGENIYRHFEMGKRPKQAVLDGVHEVGVAVITADMTTIAAFLPMLFMTGIMGFWMEIMPMIVAFTLLGSILIDHFILPVLARWFMRVRPTIPTQEEALAAGIALNGTGPWTRFTSFLARHRLLSLLLCFVPALPIGWKLLDWTASVLANGSHAPDWTGNIAYRYLYIVMTGVFFDYLLRSRLNARYGIRKEQTDEEEDLTHLVHSGGVFTRAYLCVLRYALTHRLTVGVFSVLALMAALLLPASGRLSTAFFGSTDTGLYFIKYEMPPGTSVEENYLFAEKLERVLNETLRPCECLECGWTGSIYDDRDTCPVCSGWVKGELRSTVTTLGEATAYAQFMGESGASGPEFGQIEVELFPEDTRLPVRERVKRSSTFAKSPLIAFFQGLIHDPDEMIDVYRHRNMFEIMARQREWIAGVVADPADPGKQRILGRFPGVKINVEPISEGPPTGAPINARVRGRSLPALIETAKAVETICLAQSECYNVESTHYEGRREIRVIPDRDRAAIFGLASGDISKSLFAAFQGWEVSKMTLQDEEVEIHIGNSDPNRNSIEDVRNMEIATPSGRAVALRDIARIEVGATVAVLKRTDRRQSITVTSQIIENADTAAVKSRVTNAVTALNLPQGVSIEFGGEEEEQAESMQSLFRAFFIALVLIFFILTGQFGSFKQPMVVLLTIPLSIVGAMAGLYATGNALDFMAMVGIVCLAGIVVNDAIVLVDFLNKLRARGVPMLDAAYLSAKARLRPILMTTITTIVGLLPLTLNLTGGGAFWETMGFSIIFGLIMATGLTLVVIPSFYTLVERDAWESSTRGRLTRIVHLVLYRGRIRRLLRRLKKEKDSTKRERMVLELAFQTATTGSDEDGVIEQAQSLLRQGARALRRTFFLRASHYIETLGVKELLRFADLCRHLSGCQWRVDARLGSHQIALLKEDIRNWLEYSGEQAPLGVTEERLLQARQ